MLPKNDCQYIFSDEFLFDKESFIVCDVVNNIVIFEFGKCLFCERPVLPEETFGFDFDHIIRLEKHHGISWLVNNGYSWENTILTEIDYCAQTVT